MDKDRVKDEVQPSRPNTFAMFPGSTPPRFNPEPAEIRMLMSHITFSFGDDGRPSELELADPSSPGGVLRYKLVPIEEAPCAE